jgi:serine/threonine protein kinase
VIPYPFYDIKPGSPVGAFEVIELCEDDRGGMSQVVKAVPRKGWQEDVALKISRTGPRQEFYFNAIHKEVELLQILKHPGVVRIVPVSQGKNPYKERAMEIIGNPWFFGMEFLGGGSLETYLNKVGSLTLEEATAICFQVSAALVYIHVEGFSHNDLKPENVLFRRNLKPGEWLEPVLVDFGVAAKPVKQQLDGSVVYMAPERLSENEDVNSFELLSEPDRMKADVWSIGVLLHRMLLGKEPFLGITDRIITSAILRSFPESMLKRRSDIPPELDHLVIEGCLSKDPRDRVTMQEFHETISEFTSDWRMKRTLKRKRRLFRWW